MKRDTLTAVKALVAAALMTVASITIGMATGARAEVAARHQATCQSSLDGTGAAPAALIGCARGHGQGSLVPR